MQGRLQPRIKWLLITLGCLVILLACTAVILWPYAQQGRQDRDTAKELAWLAHQVYIAGERYSIDHDGAYPESLADLRKYIESQIPAIQGSFAVFTDAKDPAGGYSYFLNEYENNGTPTSNQIVVVYAPAPSWKEVVWTMYAARSDRSNREQRACDPEWAQSTNSSLEWIGGTCGSVNIWLARGLDFNQVTAELKGKYDSYPDHLELIAVE